MNSVRAVVERPDLWQVSINGREVAQQEGDLWIDKDFPVYAVGEYLKKGRNTLSLKAPRMHILAEVMPVYILGDFLVVPGDLGFEIAEGDLSGPGSWREAGLPFYSQKVAYSQNFSLQKSENSQYKVRLKNWNGSMAEVVVNGKPAGLIAWQPDELDVTSLLKEGENEVVVGEFPREDKADLLLVENPETLVVERKLQQCFFGPDTDSFSWVDAELIEYGQPLQFVFKALRQKCNLEVLTWRAMGLVEPTGGVKDSSSLLHAAGLDMVSTDSDDLEVM